MQPFLRNSKYGKYLNLLIYVTDQECLVVSIW